MRSRAIVYVADDLTAGGLVAMIHRTAAAVRRLGVAQSESKLASDADEMAAAEGRWWIEAWRYQLRS
jgi:hypothetical protein